MTWLTLASLPSYRQLEDDQAIAGQVDVQALAIGDRRMLGVVGSSN